MTRLKASLLALALLGATAGLAAAQDEEQP